MLQIISEAEPVDICGGRCYADYIFDVDEGMRVFLDMRNYKGTLAEWAKDVEVIETYIEDFHKIFDPNSEPWCGCYPYTWKGYCSYINMNAN
jgi:hypothetical protein